MDQQSKSGGSTKPLPAYAPGYPASKTACKQVQEKKTGLLRPSMPDSRSTVVRWATKK